MGSIAERCGRSTVGAEVGRCARPPASVDEAMITERMAAVVIGRNEGDRLAPSLESVQAARLPVVYVDSGSTDESAARTLRRGVPVIELDPSRPFSAGRGRNEGLEEVLRRWPETDYVMFLDGDCVLDVGFPDAAALTFEQNAKCAIVTGHLTERHPEASIYNRLCSIEWASPAGLVEDMSALGGIMAARVSAFRSVNGFNEQAIAGEEPDLGVRLGLAGYTMVKIDQPMATHDAHMFTFRQWWIRAVRGGHALAHRYVEHGKTRYQEGRRELLSALFWGLAFPLVILAAMWPTRGLSLLLVAGYGFIGWRVYKQQLRAGRSSSDAWLVSRFNIYSRFAHVVGVLRYFLNRMRGEFHIIEYK
jgi:GT2 family glycosyltransferase